MAEGLVLLGMRDQESLLVDSFRINAMGSISGSFQDVVLTLEHTDRRWMSLPEEVFLSTCFSVIRNRVGNNCALRVLILSYHCLKTLPRDLSSLKNCLMCLDLSFNKFSSLPLPLTQLVKLEELHLKGNGLVSLCDEIKELQNLRILNLGCNDLAELPSCLTTLNKLKSLDVQRNKIITVCDEIGALQSLEEIQLQNNMLLTLPESFSQMSNLQILHISCNQLGSGVFDILCHLSNLEELYIAKNRLTEIPPAVARLNRLQRFVFGGNQLTYPPHYIYRKGMVAVMEFLSNNKWKKGSARTSNGCNQIENITITENPCYDSDSTDYEEMT